jgi:hypothetical protein
MISLLCMYIRDRVSRWTVPCELFSVISQSLEMWYLRDLSDRK